MKQEMINLTYASRLPLGRAWKKRTLPGERSKPAITIGVPEKMLRHMIEHVDKHHAPTRRQRLMAMMAREILRLRGEDV